MKGTNKLKEHRETYVLTFTEVFVNQKRINVCEHTVKIVPDDIYLMFTHIYSLLIDKDLCESQNV